MGLKKWIIISASILFVAFVIILLENRFAEQKDIFFYLNDWTSWVMLFLLLVAIKGIIEWVLKWEIRTLK
jgi:hypothetical protein